MPNRLLSVRARLVAVTVGLLFVAACSSSSAPRVKPSVPGVKLTTQPWATIHATDHPRIMLIDVAQDTDNPHSKCWIHSVTVAAVKDETFYISLKQGSASLPPNTACPGNAVAGPFYATVRLPQPYDGQALIDTASGKRHTPGPLIKLADAPSRYR